jgi:hypothetical protein
MDDAASARMPGEFVGTNELKITEAWSSPGTTLQWRWNNTPPGDKIAAMLRRPGLEGMKNLFECLPVNHTTGRYPRVPEEHFLIW